MPTLKFQNFTAAVRKPNLSRFCLFAADADVSWIDSSQGEVIDVSGTVDGSNDTFTLAKNPGSGLILFNGGLAQQPDVAYELDGKTITFKAGYIPAVDDVLWTMTW